MDIFIMCEQVLAVQYTGSEFFSCKMVCLEMNHAMHLVFILFKIFNIETVISFMPEVV